MPTVSTSTYSLSLTNNHSPVKLELNYINLDGKIIEEVIKDFAKEYSNQFSDNPKKEKIFKTKLIDEEINVNGSEYNYIYLQVESGSYGVETDIIELNTSKIVHKKKQNQSDVVRFYVLVVRPKINTDKLYVIFQSLSGLGIKTLFSDYLKEFMRCNHNGYTINLYPIAPKKYVEKLINTYQLNKMRFISFGKPQDDRNKLDINNGLRSSYSEKIFHNVTLLDKGKKALLKLLQPGVSIATFGEFVDIPDFDNIKLEFQLGKKVKTVNLQDIDSILYSEDVTDKLKLINGNVAQDELLMVMRDSIENLLEDLGQINVK